MATTPHILIVGPLPPPIGGVSSHVQRLSAVLVGGGYNCTVLDIYRQSPKVDVPGATHKVCPYRSQFLAVFWLLYELWEGHGDIIHLHFSRIVGLFPLLAFLIPKKGRKVFLTLHHGDQAALLRPLLLPFRILIRHALQGVDKIIALSPKQESFYLESGVKSENMVRLTSDIPSKVSPDNSLLPETVSGLNEHGAETILVTSGYPNKYYGYEASLHLLDYLSQHFPCRLIVSLYGKSKDPEYERDLRKKLEANPKVTLVGPLPMPGFLALLKKADLYVRPTTVDSYGLAITDALDLGVECLASDVCVRDPRCQTFPVGEMDAFCKSAMGILNEKLRGGGSQGLESRFVPEDVFRIYR